MPELEVDGFELVEPLVLAEAGLLEPAWEELRETVGEELPGPPCFVPPVADGVCVAVLELPDFPVPDPFSINVSGLEVDGFELVEPLVLAEVGLLDLAWEELSEEIGDEEVPEPPCFVPAMADRVFGTVLELPDFPVPDSVGLELPEPLPV